MKKILLQSLFGLFLLAMAFRINSQAPSSSKIYLPLDIKQAYENGIRSYEGKPGNNFWQNTCTYKILVGVTPSTKELNGKEWIEYTNNSPDTIKKLVFHAYQNAYKKGSFRSFDLDVETAGMIFGAIVIDGDTLKGQDSFFGFSLIEVPLKRYLNPHSSCRIEINWKTQIVDKPVVREGFVDSTSAFVGLWYPKMAVYDDLFKWNYNIYNFKDEFYSPLSSYDVSISLPKGFFVWATGTLQNRENYPSIINEHLENTFNSSEIEAIIDSVTSLNQNEIGKESWSFHADSVPDFAFGFSNHYLWDATTLTLRNRKILISTVYPKEQYDYVKETTQVMKNAMEIYASENPGILYPYPGFTAFYGLQGGGGMEFPMMSFDKNFGNKDINAWIIIHEMLHTYLPFYLRTNETKFAWMDEGLTDFYSFKTMNRLNFDMDTLHAIVRKYYETGIRGIGNLPLFTVSSFGDIDNWSGMSYVKPKQMLISLEDLIGIDVWQKCFVAFVQEWRYKAPMTYDFIFFVENYVKKDLFWFWDEWFMHFGYPDLAIQKVDSNKLIIENKGGLPIPFALQITEENGKHVDILYHADSWSMGRLIEINLPTSKLSKIELKCDLVNDYNLKDNIWKK